MQPLTAPPRPIYRQAPRRDPAPSRTAYRLHRLWLTPVFRALMRVGLPVFLVTMAAGIYLSDPGRREGLGERVAAIRDQLQDRPEFRIDMMAVDGATPQVADAVRAMLPVEFPVSSFDLDLEAMRAAVETIDAVARAELRVRPGGILQVDVTERVPALIWRAREDRLELLDATGHRVATLLVREARSDLPLIAGEGVAGRPEVVAEALELVAAAEPVVDRLRGLVRIGERRWDMVLDRGQRILLPQDNPVRALERVIALDQAGEMLDRDLTVVDMRNEHRPTIRLSEGAVEELRRARGKETRVAQQ